MNSTVQPKVALEKQETSQASVKQEDVQSADGKQSSSAKVYQKSEEPLKFAIPNSKKSATEKERLEALLGK